VKRSLLLGAVAASLCGCGDEIITPLPPRAYSLCPTEGIATYAAYQNEGKEWTPYAAYPARTFYFDASPRVGFAWGYGFGSSTRITILLLTIDELRSHGCRNWTFASASGKTLVGAITDFAGHSFATLALGPYIKAVSSTAPNYTLTLLPQGPMDLLAFTAGGADDKMIMRRAVDLVDYSIIPVLNFSSIEAITAQRITVQTPPGSLSPYFWSKGGTVALLESHTDAQFNASVPVVPSALVIDGDEHIFDWASAIAPGGTEQRYVRKTFRMPTGATIASGPTLNDPVVTFAPNGSRYDITVQLTSQPEYANYVDFELRDPAGVATPTHYIHVIVSAGYLGSTPTTWEINLSDLVIKAGFLTTTLPQTSTASSNIAWRARASDGPVFWEILPPGDSTTIRMGAKSSRWP